MKERLGVVGLEVEALAERRAERTAEEGIIVEDAEEGQAFAAARRGAKSRGSSIAAMGVGLGGR